MEVTVALRTGQPAACFADVQDAGIDGMFYVVSTKEEVVRYPIDNIDFIREKRTNAAAKQGYFSMLLNQEFGPKNDPSDSK